MAHSRSKHLPNGKRITDELAMGVLAKTYPTARVKAILQEQKKASQREREPPAHLMVHISPCRRTRRSSSSHSAGILQERVKRRLGQRILRGVKRKMTRYALRKRGSGSQPTVNVADVLEILK